MLLWGIFNVLSDAVTPPWPPQGDRHVRAPVRTSLPEAPVHHGRCAGASVSAIESLRKRLQPPEENTATRDGVLGRGQTRSVGGFGGPS